MTTASKSDTFWQFAFRNNSVSCRCWDGVQNTCSTRTDGSGLLLTAKKPTSQNSKEHQEVCVCVLFFLFSFPSCFHLLLIKHIRICLDRKRSKNFARFYACCYSLLLSLFVVIPCFFACCYSLHNLTLLFLRAGTSVRLIVFQFFFFFFSCLF